MTSGSSYCLLSHLGHDRKVLTKRTGEDFSGGPMVKTLLPVQEPRVDPRSGNLRSSMLRAVAKKLKKKKKKKKKEVS